MRPPVTQVSVILRAASGKPLDDVRATFDVPDGQYSTAAFLVGEAEVLSVPLGVDGQPVQIGPA